MKIIIFILLFTVFTNAESTVYEQREALDYMQKMQISINAKQYDESQKYFERAIKLYPESPLPYKIRALHYQVEKDYKKAISDYSEAIKLDPTDTMTIKFRGDLYYTINDYPSAILDYTAVIKNDPNISSYYHARGNAYKMLGQLEKATEDAKKACELGFCKLLGELQPNIQKIEPFGFKGIIMGMSENLVTDIKRGFECFSIADNQRGCSRSTLNSGTIANEQIISTSLLFYYDSLKMISLAVKGQAYSNVTSALVVKYGKPTHISTSIKQNKLGNQFKAEEQEWILSDGTIRAEQIGDKVDEMSVTFTSKDFLNNMQKSNQQDSKKELQIYK